jgi:hypothetical protein
MVGKTTFGLLAYKSSLWLLGKKLNKSCNIYRSSINRLQMYAYLLIWKFDASVTFKWLSQMMRDRLNIAIVQNFQLWTQMPSNQCSKMIMEAWFQPFGFCLHYWDSLGSLYFVMTLVMWQPFITKKKEKNTCLIPCVTCDLAKAGLSELSGAIMLHPPDETVAIWLWNNINVGFKYGH